MGKGRRASPWRLVRFLFLVVLELGEGGGVRECLVGADRVIDGLPGTKGGAEFAEREVPFVALVELLFVGAKLALRAGDTLFPNPGQWWSVRRRARINEKIEPRVPSHFRRIGFPKWTGDGIGDADLLPPRLQLGDEKPNQIIGAFRLGQLIPRIGQVARDPLVELPFFEPNIRFWIKGKPRGLSRCGHRRIDQRLQRPLNVRTCRHRQHHHRQPGAIAERVGGTTCCPDFQAVPCCATGARCPENKTRRRWCARHRKKGAGRKNPIRRPSGLPDFDVQLSALKVERYRSPGRRTGGGRTGPTR